MRSIGLLDDFDETQTVTIGVFGLACEHCESTVEDVLDGLAGVRGVEVSREEHRARVRIEPDVGVHELIDAVRSVGYEARRV